MVAKLLKDLDDVAFQVNADLVENRRSILSLPVWFAVERAVRFFRRSEEFLREVLLVFIEDV